MKLSARQSETLRDIRYLEMGGHGRAIDADEARDLCNLALAVQQAGIESSYRLTARGWRALKEAEERLSLVVTL
jgi:hypothetical protein